MSDPTKKSIVINKSFLSGSDNYNSSTNPNQNKKSKKNTRHLSEELIKPNKLKKILLDKINAKRKAEQYSSTSSSSNMSGGGSSNDILDVSKETKMFSSEFKKSLEFLDNYVNQKKTDNHKTKTLKKQNAGSLNHDILKSLHNNNNNKSNNSNVLFPPNISNQSIQTQAYIPQPVQQFQSIQPTQSTHSTQITIPVANNIQHSVPSSVSSSLPSSPIFQKIHLQIPSKIQHSQQSLHNLTPQSVPKINLAIGKTTNENLIYTELPPELQNFTPPVYSISSSSPLPSPSYSATSLDSLPQLTSFSPDISALETREAIDAREMNKLSNIENNNSEDTTNINLNKTSLSTTSTTFSPIKLTDSPYGCLKGGNKPTFRTYNKTIKSSARFSDDTSDNVYSDRQTKLRELQDKHGKKTSVYDSKNNTDDNRNVSDDSDDNDDNDDDNDGAIHKRNKNHLKKTKIRRHLRTTITKKFKLGKQAGNIVGVLIKNNDTRKNIQKEHGLLKNKQLPDIKKYLVEKNMIKIGSTAPPGVIRKIYEASILAGEVDNIGKGVVLHNFLEDKKTW
uniref:Uncharacterized protein n=1 Tax=viral metagenome TaxID=1070528 RepID=A0A6C0EWA3_9ZZZZ